MGEDGYCTCMPGSGFKDTLCRTMYLIRLLTLYTREAVV